MKTKRKHTNVPARIVADMIGAPGYLGKSFVESTIVHIVPAETFATPLCGKRGEMWDRCIEPDSPRIGYHTYDVCATCANVRQKIRQEAQEGAEK